MTEFIEGGRVKDMRRAMVSHIVKKVSLSGNPTTYCGKMMFYAIPASKKMNVCKKCKESI